MKPRRVVVVVEIESAAPMRPLLAALLRSIEGTAVPAEAGKTWNPVKVLQVQANAIRSEAKRRARP